MIPVEGVIPLLLPHAPLDVAPQTTQVSNPEGLFAQVLSGIAEGANQNIKAAEEAGSAFAAGRLDDIHGTMLSLSKADIELRFVGNVRNRVIDAFYELWRMQI